MSSRDGFVCSYPTCGDRATVLGRPKGREIAVKLRSLKSVWTIATMLPKKTPLDFAVGGVWRQGREIKPGDTYFRAGRHYHRPGELNGCVRDGNRCFLYGMVARRDPQRGWALRTWVDLV